MNVKNALPRVGAAIGHHAKPALRDSLLLGETVRNGEHFSDKLFISILQIEQGRYVLGGNDQDVNRRLGPHVFESNDGVVAIDDLSFDLSLDNAAEKTVAHEFASLPIVVELGTWLRS